MWKHSNSKMHGLSDIGPNVPAFLIKLWKLVNDPETDELICWSENGLSFIINQPAQFASELLSMYYKHNNMASFIRQLNMYGFHKIVSEAGGLKNEKDWMEFAHQYFIKDHPYLLENIKRKLPNPKSGVISNEQFTNSNLKNGTQSEVLAKVLSDVNNLKDKQESWDARLASMKRENEALWRELAIFRQKHLKQEQIINRLIHFIVTMVQPSRNVPLGRRYPLMLNDIQPVKKITKLNGADASIISQGSPSGPTIHEIDTIEAVPGNSEQSTEGTSDDVFISNSASESTPNLTEVETAELTPAEPKKKPSLGRMESIPEDWLEVEMTEGDLIDPFQLINPAEVNPAAAATFKGSEGNVMSAPIAITIPSVTTSTKSGKKNVTEKKVIYLTDENLIQQPLKRAFKKPLVLKLDLSKKRKEIDDTSPVNSLLSSVGKDSKKITQQIIQPAAAKRKIASILPDVTPEPKLKKMDKNVVGSHESLSDIETDGLDLLLSGKQLYSDLPLSRGEADKTGLDSDLSNKNITDSSLKLDSLYNGTISAEQLGINLNDSVEEDSYSAEKNSDADAESSRFSPSELLNSNELATDSNLAEESSNKELKFDPESMAVVCQQPSPAESLARDLTSHVESVQGEIDYFKEMLQGEGYSFDANNLPWLFDEDPLSYSVLPSGDDEAESKKNEEPGISGNELMAYGTPNLMDLIDVMGSATNNQDWSSVSTPASPSISDLVTPAPSPSRFVFPSPSKRRKK